jgi:hypothetical protein
MYESYIIERHANFVRLDLSKMSVHDFFCIIKDPRFSCFFVVFRRDHYLERFKLKKITNDMDYRSYLNDIFFNTIESGLDSDSFNVFEADYLDCYPI